MNSTCFFGKPRTPYLFGPFSFRNLWTEGCKVWVLPQDLRPQKHGPKPAVGRTNNTWTLVSLKRLRTLMFSNTGKPCWSQGIFTILISFGHHPQALLHGGPQKTNICSKSRDSINKYISYIPYWQISLSCFPNNYIIETYIDYIDIYRLYRHI